MPSFCQLTNAIPNLSFYHGGICASCADIQINYFFLGTTADKGNLKKVGYKVKRHQLSDREIKM